MTITEVTLAETQSSFRLKGEHVHRLRYQVQADAPMQAAQVYPACTATDQGFTSPVPRLYDIYAQDLGAYATEIEVQSVAVGNHERFDVTVTLGPLPDGHTPDDDIQDPLQFPVKIWVDWESYQEHVTEDIEGEPIRNSVGDPLVEPIYRIRYYPILVIEKNLANVTQIMDLQRQYEKTKNNGNFLGWGAGQARVLSVLSDRQMISQGVAHFPVTIRVGLRADGWDEAKISKGFRARKAAGEEPVAVEDDNGQLTSSPVLLTSTGEVALINETAERLSFEVEREVDYTPLLQ